MSTSKHPVSLMSSTRRKLCRKPVVVDIGCGCRKSKLSAIFCQKRKPVKPDSFLEPDTCRASSSSWHQSTEEGSTATFDAESSEKTVKCAGKICDSVAVEKDSDNPYLDFRTSMLQMILEKEIYSREDLCELLDCFLSLNSPSNHGIIVKAFTDIWNTVLSRGLGMRKGEVTLDIT